MESFQKFILAEMPAYNNIKKVDKWSKDTIRSQWEVIENEVEDIEEHFVSTVKGERLYAFDMRQFWGSSAKAYQFFVLKNKTPVFFASFFYEIELRAWVEDEIGKDGSSLKLVDLYNTILGSRKISFTPKRIAGINHSPGMEKVWKNQLAKKFKTSVVSRKDYKQTGMSIDDPGVWSKENNEFYVVLEKK